MATYKNLAHLDGLRNRLGLEPLKGAFHEIALRDPEQAARFLNEPNLQFPSLFALRSEIMKCDLRSRLNARNLSALDLVDDILSDAIPTTYKEKTNCYPALKWMLETGAADDGLNEHYDEVLDKVVLLLSRVHRDRACMKPAADLIFARHRKGFFIYDLVWAFFESARPDDLLLIARRLHSPHPKDVELARQLLNFVPSVNAGTGDDPAREYKKAVSWLQHNRGRLQYTGESFQQCNNPFRFAVVDASEQRRAR